MSEIKFIQGDSYDELLKLGLNRNEVILVSDPPFNVGYHYHNYNDRLPEREYFKMLNLIFSPFMHVLIHYPEDLHKYSIEIQRAPDKVVSWVYNSNTAKQHRDVAFYGVKPDLRKVGQPYKNPKDKRIAKRIAEGKKARLYDWWEVNQVKNVSLEKTAHPCQMPLEVMRRIIGTLPDSYTIVDPFCGSGTTALACLEFGRDFIGIDMDNTYIKIAEKRKNDFVEKTMQ